MVRVITCQVVGFCFCLFGSMIGMQSTVLINAQEAASQLILDNYSYTICEGDTAFVIITVRAFGNSDYKLEYQRQDGVPLVKTQEDSVFILLSFDTEWIDILAYGREGDIVEIHDDPVRINIEAYPAPSVSFIGGGTFCDISEVEPLQLIFEGDPPFDLNYRIVDIESETVIFDSLIGYSEYQYADFPTQGNYQVYAMKLADMDCRTESPKSAYFKLVDFTEASIIGDSLVCAGEEVVYSTDLSGYGLHWSAAVGNEADIGLGDSLNVQWTEVGVHQVSLIYDDLDSHCSSPAYSIDVCVLPTPDVVHVDTTVCFNVIETFQLRLADSGDEIVWNELYVGLDSLYQTISSSGSYIYTQTNYAGCSATDTIEIENDCRINLFVPEAFTPNGDRINENLKLSGICLGFDFMVYSPDGTRLFELHGDEGWQFVVMPWWDGVYEGKLLPQGNYYWQLVYTDFENKAYAKQGVVTLLK